MNVKTYISMITSWLLTLASLIEVLLKVIALPSAVAQIILGVLLVISLTLTLYFFKHNNAGTKTEAIPEDVRKYLNSVRGGTYNSGLDVIAEKFDLTLGKGPNNAANQETVMQEIKWTLVLANTQSTDVGAFYMPVSLSSYTAWESHALKITVNIQGVQKCASFKLDFDSLKSVENAPHEANMRILPITFPAGMELHPNEQVSLLITMRWLIGCQFDNKEFFFTDPENYGNHIQRVNLIFTPEDVLSGWQMNVYEIDKKTRIMDCKKSFTLKGESVEWTTSQHKKGAMYLLQFSKKP